MDWKTTPNEHEPIEANGIGCGRQRETVALSTLGVSLVPLDYGFKYGRSREASGLEHTLRRNCLKLSIVRKSARKEKKRNSRMLDGIRNGRMYRQMHTSFYLFVEVCGKHGLHPVKAVSYTHLDVYKRQVLG